MVRILSKQIFLFGLLIIIGISACDFFDPEEQVPAFVTINTMELDTKIGEGSGNHNFKDAWVYLDGTLLGIMEVPGELPVLDSGMHEISIFPGIRINGISGSPNIYYACGREDFELNLVPGESIEIKPVFKYADNIDMLLVEDFEANLQFTVDIDGNAETNVQRVQTDVFEGSFSGEISLDGDNSIIEVGTKVSYDDIPFNVAEVYLEMQYKNEIDFSVGVQAINAGLPSTSVYLVGLRPTEEWKKVYIRFTDLIRESGSDAYKIVLQAANLGSSNEKKILLDNIKLIMLN